MSNHGAQSNRVFDPLKSRFTKRGRGRGFNKEDSLTAENVFNEYSGSKAFLFLTIKKGAQKMNFLNKNTNKHERIIQCLSLSMIVIASGLFISIPFVKSAKVEKFNRHESTLGMPNLDQLCRPDVKERPWEYIVIHHSATAKGNAARFDYYHKKIKGWEYGLAYHFVVGNGSFSGDGEIEVGNRWKKQIHGAHTANMNCNRVAIGICLVGDFENGGSPKENQFESLVSLVQYLSRKYNIPSSNILEHKDVHQKATACPGKNFPFTELKTRLMQIASKSSNHKEL